MPMLGSILLFILTWPYNNNLRKYTLQPIYRIAARQPDVATLSHAVQMFAEQKRSELSYVNVAAAVNAALVLGSFSIQTLGDTPWGVPALLYSSLMLAVFAIVIGAQQNFLLDLVPQDPDENAEFKIEIEHNICVFAQSLFASERRSILPFSREQWGALGKDFTVESVLKQRRPAWVMMYMWQCPIMLMAWSWLTYILGISVHVARPFVPKDEKDPRINTAIFYFAVVGTTVLNFFWCTVCAHVTRRGSEDLPTVRRAPMFGGPLSGMAGSPKTVVSSPVARIKTPVPGMVPKASSYPLIHGDNPMAELKGSRDIRQISDVLDQV